MIESILADLFVYFVCFPILYALLPGSFERTVKLYMRYVRWAGKGIIDFVVRISK
jgi:hypothetical protein